MSSSDVQQPVESTSALHGLPRIGGYRLLRRLGHGGMAMVYLAVQESLDREVAIKVMRPARHLDAAQSVRFEHEARIIAKLEHPGIVVIHEVGRTLDGDLYYVMPYLARGDLAGRDYREDEAGLVALLRVLLDALGYAHARGIVHRDVKAENVLFDNADRPQLADFGIALASRAEGDARVTGDGLAVGSSALMSPEQARAGSIDGRADLYSVGVLTYELLTGELPYHADDSLALALMHANDPIPLLPADKARWQSFIEKAMAKRPEQRFRNAQAMQRALDPIERQVRRGARPLGRVQAAIRRRPLMLVAIGAVFSMSLIALAVSLRSGSGSGHALSDDAMRGSAAAQSTATDERATTIALALARARAQLAAGDMLDPPRGNAADSFLEVLDLDAGNAAAREGLGHVFEKAAPAFVGAVQHDDRARVGERVARLEAIATRTDLAGNAAYAALREQAAGAALARARLAADELAREDASAWLELAARLGAVGEESARLQARVAALPEPGGEWRDAGGPALRIVPAKAGASVLPQGFLVMRDEVSRGDYAAFVRASGHAASRCRSRLSPLRLFDRRDWNSPGFAQTDADPVVCVSHADALAYARWLGTRTGKVYRLPSRAEWRHFAQAPPRVGACAAGNVLDRSATAGSTRHDCDDGFANTAPSGRFAANAFGLRDLFGNVAEWSADCEKASRDGCERRAVMGASWRDGRDDVEGARALDDGRGWDDVGFRLVRAP